MRKPGSAVTLSGSLSTTDSEVSIMPGFHAKPLPPLSQLRNLFHYDPDTGALTRRTQTVGQRAVGTIAGWVSNRRYRIVEIDGKGYQVHRIAYALGTGRLPPPDLTVDHVNADTLDNRLVNLRLATKGGQNQNRPTVRPRKKTHEHLPRGVQPNWKGYSATVRVTRSGTQVRAHITLPTPEEAGYAAALLRKHYHGAFAAHGEDTPAKFERLGVPQPDLSEVIARTDVKIRQLCHTNQPSGTETLATVA